MPLNVRHVGGTAVLSNVARSMNDPRYSDVGREVDEILDQGFRRFVVELRNVRDTGSTLLGVLMTMTRRIRSAGGEVVLAEVSRNVRSYIEEMRLDDFWDLHESVQDGIDFLERRRGLDRVEPADTDRSH